MHPDRRIELQNSLQQQLEEQTRENGFGPLERASWLSEQLENYVERWLAFCAIPTISMTSLLDNDLFEIIQISVEMLSDELETLPSPNTIETVWYKFHSLLNYVQEQADRGQAERLREALSNFQVAIHSHPSRQ